MYLSFTTRAFRARGWAAAHFCVIFSLLFQGCSLRGQSIMNVVAYGAVPDGIMRTDGAMVAGSAVLSSQSGSFTSGDVGKYIQVIGAGPGGTSKSDGTMSFGSAVLTSASGIFASSDVGRGIVVIGAGPSGGNLVTTIQSYTSPTTVSLSTAAQTQVSGKPYFYGAMTLEGTIQSVQGSSIVTLSTPALSTISTAVFAYGTENHASFQAAVDAAGQAGGGTVNVPAPSTCPTAAVCGYVIKATDQMTAQAPGAVKIRYNNISLIGSAPQTNLFCRGAYGTYSGEVAFNGATGNIRGFCLTIGDNGGPNGVAGEAVSNITISNLHLYGMTNGNTFNVNFGYPPQSSDGWDITHKGIYMWDNSPGFANITIDSVIIQDFKAENIYSGGSPITGMVIENSTLTNFNGNGISMLAADLQVLNNTISNGSNAAVENSTVSKGAAALIRQLYQGNTVSQFPREGIVVVGVDGGVASGSVQIVNNYFDAIAQTNPSGTESAIYIASQNNFIPPANVTVTGNTCHDCQSFGVFETSGNTVIQSNAFIVDRFNAGSVFSFTYQLNGVTITDNTGTNTGNGHSLGSVYLMNPGYASGSFPWNNVVVKGNTWTFPGTPQYEFVTTSGLGWSLVTQHNLTWQGDSCSGCTHSDVNHGVVDLSRTNLIEPYGPVVYVNGNSSPVTVTIDAAKEQDGAQLQVVNAGSNSVSFASDSNLSLSSPITLPGGGNGSVTFVYSAALGKYTTSQSGDPAAVVSASNGTPQSARVNTTFGTALQAVVKDASNNLLSGVTVTFTAPSTGATGSFSGSFTATAVTNSSGVATAPTLTANGQIGSFTITANVAGVISPASFSLTNTAAIAGGGSLSGSGNSVTTTFNLTSEGTADWVHWGDAALNRKAGVTPQISTYMVVGSGPVITYTNDPRALSWTDGTPTSSGSNNSGVYINSLQNGFAFTAPADTNKRSLTVHVGGYMGGGTFTAHLSDGSAADYTDSTAVVNGQFDRNYTVTYIAASAGQTLTISWVITSGTGNVTLNGAALSLAAPSITATAGTPQSATVNTAFNTALQAVVTDSNNNPLSGVTVTFSAPVTGASASFGGSATAAAATNANGIAIAPALTANSQPGSYLVTAIASGITTTATYSLINLAGTPASIAATAGTPQSATVNTAFGTALQVLVKDAGNNVLSGVTVTFTAPTTGATASFGGSATATVLTNTSGIAVAPALTANGQAGSFAVTASVAGVATPASFSLTNLTGAAASITATAGTPQSASVNKAFGTALQAVVKDSGNNPVSGATVTFTAPSTGATGAFSGSATTSVVTNASGVATAPALTANGQAGSYAVTASVAGVTAKASFSLTNIAGSPASIASTAGTPQSATVNTIFGTNLQVVVKDASSNPLNGVTVTFSAPTSGATAAFNGSATATAITNSNGIATAPALTADGQTGSYTVAASTAGVGVPASFSLTNNTASSLPIKLVQGNTLDSLINLQSATLAFKSSNTAGNWIGVIVSGTPTNTDSFTITDSNGNTYRSAFVAGSTALNSTLGIYYAENIKGGANTVRVIPNAGVYLRIVILEYSGIATANSLDVTAAALGDSASANSGNATTRAAGDLLLGAVITGNGHSITASAGYTFEEYVPAPPSTKLSTEDQIQAAAGTTSAGASLGAVDNWLIGFAAFKAAQ